MGLNGSWHRDSSFGSLNTIGDALNAINGRTADATFGVIDIDYPEGSINTVSTANTPLADFLGSNAYGLRARAGMSLSDSLYSQLTNSVFVFSGTLQVDSSNDIDNSDPEIDVTFRVGSDDGFQLRIGTEVIGSTNVRSFQTTDVNHSFAAAGQYDFELIYFERSGNTGVELTWLSGSNSGFESLSVTSIPEPSAACCMLLVSGVIACRRRR